MLMSFTYEIFALSGASLHPDYGWLTLQSLPSGTRPHIVHRNYHVKYILDGSATFLFENKELFLKKGQGIFIPNEKEYEIHINEGLKILDIVVNHWGNKKTVFNEFIRLTNGEVTATGLINLNVTYKQFKDIINVPSDLNRILIKNKSEYMALSVLEELSRSEKSEFKQKIETITNNENVNFNLKTLCELTGYSQTHFERLMLKNFGCSAIEYFNRIRINKICSLLKTTSLTLPEIAEKCGFYDTSHLHTFFKKRMGTTPGKYRKGYFVNNF